MPPDPRTSPVGSPRVLAGPLSTTGFKGDPPALNLYRDEVFWQFAAGYLVFSRKPLGIRILSSSSKRT
ncbi:MAG: hypothetical protein HY401_09210 [Elusimicrobia bacterium]|nr:hypothetical protein [Elusimicrobiota bacterium]